MTRERFEFAVRSWQSRLGLTAWDVSVAWEPNASGEGATEDADVTTWRSDSYDRATIYPSPVEFESWSDVRANQLVVHELLHLSIRDVDQAFASLEGQVHPDAYRMLEKRYDHEIEGVIDRLACRLVEIGGSA